MGYSVEEKAMWIEDWSQSGKSAWSYAKENGLNPRTFVKWTKEKSEASFVELPVLSIPPLQYAHEEILIEKGEVKIHIPLTVGHNELRAVMEGLGGVL